VTPDTVGPFSRPVRVDRLPPEGTETLVEAGPEERAALARDFGLPEIRSLVGRFRLVGSPHRVQVTGRVTADLAQTCVVTLEPFDAVMEEEVDVDFSAADAFRGTDAEDAEMPDPIVNGTIDLGSLAAEFLALGLDPYPRKPGVAFEEPAPQEGASPFAALGRLQNKDGRP
jgi:hypothetical protein